MHVAPVLPPFRSACRHPLLAQNVAEMAVFRRANAGVQQAARDVSEASALLGPGMPRVDPGALSR